jgi:CHAD domain-containing protein
MSPQKQRYALLETRLKRFTRMLHGIESAEPRAIHRTRVASRRLRELLPVLQLEPAVTRKAGRRLRKITRTLGPLREADVLLDLFERLQKQGRSDSRALLQMVEHVRKKREQAREDALAKSSLAAFRRLGRRLEHVKEELERSDEKRGHPSRGWRWALDARVARRAQTLRSAIMKAGAVYLHERLHAVRLAVKKLRYAIELAADADGMASNVDLVTLRRAQEVLGRIHDLQVLTDHVRQAQASLTPPDVMVWREFDALVTSLEHECRRLHARYVRDSARLLALCDRLSARASAAARRTG